MNKAKFALIFKILTVIFALLTTIIITAGTIMNDNAAAVSGFLGARTQIIYEEESDEEENTIYFPTEYASVAEERANSEKLCRDVVAEGATLLKNDNALPLAAGSKLSLFSASSVNIAIGGGGSSVTNATSVGLKEALEDPSVGFDVNDGLWEWYGSHTEYGRKTGAGIGARSTINEAPWDVLPAAKTESAAAAVFVLTRVGSEDADAYLNSGNDTDMTNGNYLALSPAEITVLKGLKAEKDKGTFGKIVLLMNTANHIEMNFADSEEYGIDAILWCGTVGSTGTQAIADILAGKVNPSGRLSDTFWANHRYNPVNANFGDYTFGGTMADGGDPENLAIYDYGTTYRVGYVVYQEGIYVGYRYTETRYEDYVLARNGVGEYDYDEVVTYPFGYGLSYTTFDYGDFDCTYDEQSDKYTVSVRVTNTGDVAGKETVQLYLQKPYTAYDVENGVEKASAELVGFAKTGILSARGEEGDSEVVSIEVNREYFASYDSNGAETYILDSGDYYLTAAKDSHDAVNNILAKKRSEGAVFDESRIVHEENAGTGNAELVEKITMDFGSDIIDAETYSVSTAAMESGISDSPAEITNKFDYADINRYANKDDNSVTYVSRNNWNDTVKFGIGDNNEVLENHVRLTLNAGLESDLREEKYQNPAPDDIAYPTYGSTKTNYTLMDLRAFEDGDDDPSNDEWIPYDHEMWDDLLDQLTWDDTVAFLSCGERMTSAIDSISKPQTIDHNGAIGVNQKYNGNPGVNRGFAVTLNDPDANSYPPAYPCNGIAAATFNTELMREYGEAWGEDALWAGYSGLFGPGLNMHRSPYAGRNFEYYSEDSFLAGRICANLCYSIEKKGIYVYLKHPLLNDQEEGRRTISTWANEQTIREIYLRPFEMAIKEGGARNVMTGLNKVGPTSNVLNGFADDVLRAEFGMTGFVITDYMHNAQSQIMPIAHVYGTDLPDRDYSGRNAYARFEKNHGEIAWAMRESVHRILYTVVHSAGMNGFSANTRVITITPEWQYYLGLFTTLSIAFLIASALMLVTCYAFPAIPDAIVRFIKKRKASEEGGNNE